MSTYTFYFRRNKEKHNSPSRLEVQEWEIAIKNLRAVFKKWKTQLYSDKPKDFKITIDKVSYSIPAYWVLIGVVEDWLFEQGNIHTKEEVSEMFKHLAGHTKILNGVEVSRSIATSSDCTWQDMNKLLNCILAFGEENNIAGCELKEKDREDIKKSFSKD